MNREHGRTCTHNFKNAGHFHSPTTLGPRHCSKEYLQHQFKLCINFSMFDKATRICIVSPIIKLFSTRISLLLGSGYSKRVTALVLASDREGNAISVLVHYFFMPERPSFGFILSISHLIYSKKNSSE